MPGGKDIPYQLRPNKFIDRQIFLDLLGRVIPQKPVGQYVYVSMGGKHLVDHEAMYRRVGIKNLYSFDGDAGVVARQERNKPLEAAVCVEMMSSSLASELDAILERFAPAASLVLWLDYTRPNERLSQLQELTECLKKAQAGDVIRITMNADPRTLRRDWEKEGFDGPGEYRAHRLREQIGDYLHSEIEEIAEDELPAALARAVSLACSIAQEEIELTFVPVLITSYADGQRMMTATVLVMGEGDELPEGLTDWEFIADSWSNVIEISAPDLSLREKVAIDRYLTRTPEEIIEAVAFAPASELDDAHRALESYKRLHRFYPTFMAMGIQ